MYQWLHFLSWTVNWDFSHKWVRQFMGTAKKKKSAAKPVSATVLQAEEFRQTRRDHASEIAEDYAEAIADLADAIGEARVVDLAKRLGVTHVTVNRTIARLQRDGFVTSQP